MTHLETIDRIEKFVRDHNDTPLSRFNEGKLAELVLQTDSLPCSFGFAEQGIQATYGGQKFRIPSRRSEDKFSLIVFTTPAWLAAVKELRDHFAELEPPPPPPADPPAPLVTDDPFRPAKEFLDTERFPDFKTIHKHLAAHPEVRTRKPSPRRLKIHAADWIKSLANTDPLDLPCTVVDAIRDAETRKAEINRGKGRK